MRTFRLNDDQFIAKTLRRLKITERNRHNILFTAAHTNERTDKNQNRTQTVSTNNKQTHRCGAFYMGTGDAVYVLFHCIPVRRPLVSHTRSISKLTQRHSNELVVNQSQYQPIAHMKSNH